MVLWLVRHGETVWTAQGHISGWHDVPLTSRGEEQARALRQCLARERFDSAWSSDLQRARRTAELAWGPVRVDRRLRELDFGEMEGRVWETEDPRLKEALLAFDGFRAPGGEHVDELRARVGELLGELPGGRHLLFTHAGVIRMLLREVGDDRFVPPASQAAVDWERRQVLWVRLPQ